MMTWTPLLLSLLALQVATGNAFIPFPVASAQSSFTFSASGDYGTDPESLPVIVSDGGDFHLALGDLSYSGNEAEWCRSVRSDFNNWVLVSGNHDHDTSDGDIHQFVVYCPFPLGSFTGDYGMNYYFDYPASDPLIRIILGSPGISPDTGSGYDYDTGGNGYVFVRDAIRDARSKGIPWVVFGSHKVCLEATGDKSCEVGEGLMGMLFQERVDLVLMAHAHTYQRSHQLSCGSWDRFTQSCVVDQDGEFAKGAGTVQVIQGIGGRSIRERGDGSEPDFDYFSRVMGGDGCWPESNCPPSTYGIVQYTVTATSITGKAIAYDGTVFDTFAIGPASGGNGPATGGPSSSIPDNLQAWWPVVAVGVVGLLVSWAIIRGRRGLTKATETMTAS